MKTVLFAWELGGGSGHLANMRRLATRLRSRGVRIIAAVTRLDSIAVLDDAITEIHRMPNWRIDDSELPAGTVRSSATLNDTLVGVGLADPAFVQRLVAAWDRLYRTIDPALVIADYAPAAALAARGRIPLLMTGNGYTLPPPDMPAFPPLHRSHPPLYRDEDSLAAVNGAMNGLGLRTLDRLPQLFAGDAHLVFTLPLFDHYAAFRRETVAGPLLDYLPQPRRAAAADVLAYFSPSVEVRSDVIAALLPVADRLRIHAPTLPEARQSELARRGAHIAPQLIDLASALPHCRLIVHAGGNNLGAEALFAGVPQLCLATHIDQHLTALALEREGVGRCFPAHDHALTLPARAVQDMYDDEALIDRAVVFGAQQRDLWRPSAAIEAFDSACARLLP